MGRARDYRRLRAPSLVIVSNLNAPVSPGGKIVFYMRLEALRSSLVTIRPLLLLQLLLAPPPLSFKATSGGSWTRVKYVVKKG